MASPCSSVMTPESGSKPGFLSQSPKSTQGTPASGKVLLPFQFSYHNLTPQRKVRSELRLKQEIAIDLLVTGKTDRKTQDVSQ